MSVVLEVEGLRKAFGGVQAVADVSFAVSAGELLARDPRKVVELAVWGMLPKNRLSRKLMKKLKVYSGSEHPHSAQQPQAFEITQVAQ